MTHDFPDILKQFRGPGPCLYCKRHYARLEAAHIIAKGRDNCNQLDVAFNLASLGGAFRCNCHGEHHAGREPTQDTLFALVAARDGWRDGAQVEAQVRRILRAPPQKDGARVCPTCKAWGWLQRLPTGEYVTCWQCDGSGVLIHGEPWIEQPRTLAGS